MPWYLYHAFKQLFPTGRWFPFFTLMSGLGVAIGVMLLYVASSVMGGFGYEIGRMIINTQGEIQVVGSGVLDDSEQLMGTIMQVEGVAAATPSAHGQIGMLFENRPAWPEIQGIDLATVDKVFDLERYLRIGSLDNLDDDSVILSSQLARDLQVNVGDEVQLYSPLLLWTISTEEIILPRVARVVGIFEIGHQQLDRSLVICSLRLMQDLYGLESAVHSINVRITPGSEEHEVARRLNLVLPTSRRALTWFETNEDFQNIIMFEKYMVIFLLAFIVLIAALSIMSSLLISVVRKTREIGLLGALGGTSRSVAASFCLQGLLLGISGTMAGLACGWVILHFRNEIVKVVARATVGEDVFLQFYQFVDLPQHTKASDLVVIVIGSILFSTLAGLVPAWRAARLKPVEALRSE